ncbi:PTS transporter subunit EIIB [Paenibacillus sp. FSL M7-0134]
MNYDQLAKEILSRVGGIESVTRIVHCVTRLRFQLKDEGLSKTEWLRQE